MNEETARRNRVTGFLLGLGFGLVVGIIFQPRAEDVRRLAERSESGRRETSNQGIPEF